ncbi:MULTISPECIES: PD-(D/E)XK nuclease-like domain-containing protein [unclassified Arsenophonus]|uniref:PD-(D/E)XK nuclease-like domain-containing protein n=1 Tax=unclassified Arsenophonus TaxID=2627083 RepID=UPI0028578D34|nr:PD-(D/E)XK nuclease-like domain-containing protein [Arsenophonus sp.]MDR5609283.1 PD-(D/E)XK nuclease-like domain-containing protein [Arsenophonus sp.]MDR5613015.1 PD-(D/E)XK nuclease-like domain-containing protein [Arsenophonus sp.]
MLKDARISLMYYHRRHITKEIQFERSEALDFGNLFHTLVLEPAKVATEFSLQPAIPDNAFTNIDSMKKWLEEYNAKLPQPMSLDELKAIIEQHNATLPEPLSLSGSLEEIGNIYMSLPEAFKTIPGDNKHTSIAMKACIKTYNATLPVPLKTTGNKENLLEQIQIIDADLANLERKKPNPLKTSGKKEELIQIIKSINPDAVFADELIQAWINDNSRICVTDEQYQLAKAMQQAVFDHPETGKLVNHPNKAVEVSYYGIDENTGLEIRVRPDLEIQLSDDHRIGFDLKSASLGRFKQDAMASVIKREIVNRDYHISAAMYCDIAMLDQFFWIFVNKDENYHWVAIVEASPELLELGRLEYKKTLRDINNSMNTGDWPAPITDTLTIKLTDFESRKLEELQLEVA